MFSGRDYLSPQVQNSSLAVLAMLALSCLQGQNSFAQEVEPRSTLKGPAAQVSAVGLANDDKLLAVLHWRGSGDPCEICLWDLATSKQGTTLSIGKSTTRMVLSTDGKSLAAAQGETVSLWDVAGRKERAKLKGTGRFGWFTSLVFTSDGKMLASGYSDGTLVLWDVTTGKPRATLQEAGTTANSVGALAFTPDGKILVSGGSTLRIWDVLARRLRGELKGHRYGVKCVAITADGKIAASGTYAPMFNKPGELKLWNLEAEKEVADLKGHTADIVSVAFSPDGKIVASGGGDVGGGEVKLWDAAKRSQLASMKGHEYAVSAVVFTRDGKTLVTGSVDCTVKLWDVAELLKKQPHR